MKNNKQYMIEHADYKILSDLAKKNYTPSSIDELNLIFSNIKVLINRSDFDRLTEIVNSTLDEPDKITLDGIAAKYSINKLINKYKVELWSYVKKYKVGTDENQKAHFDYMAFSEYIKQLGFESDKITYDVILDIINNKLYSEN